MDASEVFVQPLREHFRPQRIDLGPGRRLGLHPCDGPLLLLGPLSTFVGLTQITP